MKSSGMIFINGEELSLEGLEFEFNNVKYNDDKHHVMINNVAYKGVIKIDENDPKTIKTIKLSRKFVRIMNKTKSIRVSKKQEKRISKIAKDICFIGSIQPAGSFDDSFKDMGIKQVKFN